MIQFLETRKDLDRTGWPPGPWDDEADYYYGLDETGFECLIVRNTVGSLCGYVGVDLKHPWHGKHYSDIDAAVHGGLTYASECSGKICHPTEIHDRPLWWIGFDCAHAYDVRPGHLAMGIRSSLFDETYRDVNYVRAEVEKLARQAAEAK